MADLWDWHSRSIRGERMPIHEGTPQVGYFLTRLEARGRLVPGSIWLEQPTDENGDLCGDERYRAEILGEEQQDVDSAWLFFARRPICRLEYLRQLGRIF